MFGGGLEKMSFSTPPRSVQSRAASTTKEAPRKSKTLPNCDGFESNSGAPKLLSNSFGARQTVRNPLQIEMVFAFARASFVVLAALRSTDRGGVEKDICEATPPNANLNYLKASWTKTSKSNRQLFGNRRVDFEVFGHEALR